MIVLGESLDRERRSFGGEGPAEYRMKGNLDAAPLTLLLCI